jgi:thiamine-monophosphate kinase
MLENDLLDSLPALFATGDAGVITGAGPDDCAHVETVGRRLALSMDAFAEGSHFLPDAKPEDVARKALGASLSDLAASGCRARWALVALCLRRGAGGDWAERFARELAAAAAEFGVSIIGGDTVSAPNATCVSITVIGEPLPGGPILRSGGNPGDVLAVTGTLGGSIRGRHLRPEPRLREIERLLKFSVGLTGDGRLPTAAMDISDGLALDLSRLCRASGVGATLDADLIPLSDAARELAAETGRTALAHALTDGEDFELLVAMPPRLWDAFARHQAAAASGSDALAAFTRIGALTAESGLRLRAIDGGETPLEPEGYQHQW